MYYGNIKTFDIADGPGVRVSLFVSGCRNHCKNCFQPETWDFHYGVPFDEEAENRIFYELDRPEVRGLTLLGGDPFEPENQEVLVPFLRKVKANYPAKDIWSFTGYVYEHLPQSPVTQEFLDMLDVLVDGPFVEELKQAGLRFRGSKNQRLIDMKKTREAREVVLWDDGYIRGQI